ncbi:hypothetical protein V8E36_005941 [Tilletia maclaganii]
MEWNVSTLAVAPAGSETRVAASFKVTLAKRRFHRVFRIHASSTRPVSVVTLVGISVIGSSPSRVARAASSSCKSWAEAGILLDDEIPPHHPIFIPPSSSSSSQTADIPTGIELLPPMTETTTPLTARGLRKPVGIDEQLGLLHNRLFEPLRGAPLFKGISPPSGATLHGPPGIGKTMLTKFAAAQAPSDVNDEYLGQSEKKCSVQHQSISAQLLVELDQARDHNVAFLATTNCLDAIDPALLRRLTLRLNVPKPDLYARRAILVQELAKYSNKLSAKQIDMLALGLSPELPPELPAPAHGSGWFRLGSASQKKSSGSGSIFRRKFRGVPALFRSKSRSSGSSAKVPPFVGFRLCGRAGTRAGGAGTSFRGSFASVLWRCAFTAW